MPMLSTAVALSVITVSGFVVVYQKMPRQIRRFLEKHSLMTDAMCLIGTYYFLGGTITALIAAGLVSLAVSGLLEIANNSENYLYIYDLKNYIKSKLNNAKEALNTYGQQYRQKQLHMSGMQESEIST